LPNEAPKIVNFKLYLHVVALGIEAKYPAVAVRQACTAESPVRRNDESALTIIQNFELEILNF